MSTLDHAGYVELNRRPLGGHARLQELVGTDKRILDVGCSSGYLARPLVEHLREPERFLARVRPTTAEPR